ncbi:ornithine cyclodeaminase family protein [Haloarcula sp. S1AR25-5A]|uniref:Alanine dehydrogenase n=1 Tax=Haloarcula terrestris TaxID=2950533 RepID=A0AAE4EUN1_9EURY|nr:ornithine cyclodeaminase family protein [Haloarcula terrestris]MDS0220433.1 ornithine cyclodeaminase family protein [Haloarcula terrestris]
MQTLLLGADAVEDHAAMPAVIDAVAAAFAADARDNTIMPAKSYIDLPQYNGDFRSMPAYVNAETWDAAAVKWVNVHLDNPRDHDLPTVLGTLIYSDPETAFPLAVMDGTVLTRLRTGAAAAVATDHLAVDDATSLGLVGAGTQAYTQLEAISSVRDIETVVVADRDTEKQQAFVDAFDDRFDVRAGTIEDAAGCDVLSTITPVESPIVEREWLGDRTHVNAIGADAAGKQEHDERTLLDSKLVIDNYEQCTHSGEINVPWGAGVLTDTDLHGELGDIVAGKLSGRTDDDGITVFDSTGLAIQDVAAAHVVYENASADGDGTAFSLVDTDTS